MINTRKKGQRTELKCEKELKKKGWLTHRVKGSTKFNREVDLFGLFDILSLKLVKNKQKRLWIQVKTNNMLYGKELIPFKEFKKKYCDENDKVLIYNWIDRKGWKIKTI